MWRRSFGRRGRPSGGPPVGEGGFTLIELMATVGILATLSSIALPKFADLIESANERNDKQILRRIRLGIQMYYDDNDFFPPDISAGGGAPQDIKGYFQAYFDTGDHRFPVPKSNLGVATPTRPRGTVKDQSAAGLTNSNYHALFSASYEDFGYNNQTGAFVFETLYRDKSPFLFGPEGNITSSGAGVPKCVWGSDRDPGRDQR